MQGHIICDLKIQLNGPRADESVGKTNSELYMEVLKMVDRLQEPHPFCSSPTLKKYKHVAAQAASTWLCDIRRSYTVHKFTTEAHLSSSHQDGDTEIQVYTGQGIIPTNKTWVWGAHMLLVAVMLHLEQARSDRGGCHCCCCYCRC